ncbi:MAG: PAS domain S-box protein [Dehalococcoidia bacterium]|nr:PAS domain S-box protein [Dehalococcoidia bacterium]
MPYTRADGEQRWGEIHASRIDYDGEGRVLVVAFDVTEGQHAEDALRASEERLRTVVEGIPAGVWMSDGEGIALANSGLAAITGYTREQLLEPGFFGTHVLHPEDHDFVLERGRRRVQGEDVPASYEVRLIRSDGAVRWVQLEATRIDDYQGKPASLIVCIDLTERREAEEQRLAMESRMQQAQKMESLGVLAGGIAHDFNNLLVGILGNADIALGELSESSAAHEVVESIQLAATRAAELTRQMLAYSGKGRFVVERVDLSELVQEMAHLLDVSISRRARLRFDFTPALPAVEADATQVRQVVMNLITNASDALGDREGVISVRTGVVHIDPQHPARWQLDHVLTEGDYVSLEVTDTGDGMDEATRSKVFDPFFTTKFTGRGLGLAAVLGIVRGHKGAIHVDSQPGEGTTFTVLLPVAGTADDRSQDAGGRPERWRGTGRVLVIDDDQTVRTVTERMVRSAGFDVDLAADGEAGVAAFEANAGAYAAVLLDLTMPGLDGEEVFRRVRAMRPDVPVILTSGFSEQEATGRFAGAGLAGFLQKPYGMADLRAALRHAIEGPGPETA